MKNLLILIAILLLTSCNGGESSKSQTESTSSNKTDSAQDIEKSSQEIVYEIETKIYSKMSYGGILTYFAYEFDVKCTEDKCYLEGRIYEGQNYQRTVYSAGYYEASKIELDRVGDVAIAEVCRSGYGCLNFRLNQTNSLSVDDGVNCHKGNVNTNESEFRASLIRSNVFAQPFQMGHTISASSCY